MDSYQLPFELSTSAATAWLHSLNHLNSVNSADQLHKVIRQLKSIESETESVLKILLLLTPTILNVCSTIELSFLTDTEDKESKQSRKIEKLCFQLLRHFILAISHIVCTKTLAKKDQSLAIFMALHVTNFNQRLSAILRQPPTSFVWKTVGDLYTLANDNNIFTLVVDHQIKELHNQTTIECAIKHTLLFNILYPHPCDSLQIKALFIFAQSNGKQLTLKTHKPNKNCFFWDPISAEPPYQHKNQGSTTTISINTEKLLSLLQVKTQSTLLDKPALTHAINQLSAYEELIESALPSMLIINHVLIGITEISGYLKKINKLNKIQQLSKQYLEIKPQETLPLTFEKSSLNSNNKENLLEQAMAVKILQANNEHYIIAETNEMVCQIGNIILRLGENTLELGIIRQQKTTNQSGTTHTLIEKIIGIPSTELISNAEITEKQILVVNNKNLTPTIFLPPCKLSNGTKMTSTSGKSYTLDQLINYSCFYLHYSVDQKTLN